MLARLRIRFWTTVIHYQSRWDYWTTYGTALAFKIKSPPLYFFLLWRRTLWGRLKSGFQTRSQDSRITAFPFWNLLLVVDSNYDHVLVCHVREVGGLGFAFSDIVDFSMCRIWVRKVCPSPRSASWCVGSPLLNYERTRRIFFPRTYPHASLLPSMGEELPEP